EKLIYFLLDVVVFALKFVRFIFFSILSVIQNDLNGKRKWAEECTAEENAEATSSMLELDDYDEDFWPVPHFERIEDRFGINSLCMQGSQLKPCGEVDLSEYYL
ncbi:unnamed protein product, partial [Effrenium voratum]